MFHGARSFDAADLGGWDVSRVTNMRLLFGDAFVFRGRGLEHWNVGRVIDMHCLFSRAELCVPDLSRWDVGRVTDMEGMFRGARSFDADLGDWDVRAVQTMRYMFYGARNFRGLHLERWKTKTKTKLLTRKMFQYSPAALDELAEDEAQPTPIRALVLSYGPAMDPGVPMYVLFTPLELAGL